MYYFYNIYNRNKIWINDTRFALHVNITLQLTDPQEKVSIPNVVFHLMLCIKILRNILREIEF